MVSASLGSRIGEFGNQRVEPGQLAFEIVQLGSPGVEFGAELRVLRAGFFEFLIQPLNGRQRHAVGVHGGDVFVVRGEAEGGVEILRRRAEVFLIRLRWAACR
jgi:hypothetical protein